MVRRIDEGDSYNLLGRSALTGLNDQILSTFLDAFSQMNEQGLNMPDITKTVEAPALQVVPVAVFPKVAYGFIRDSERRHQLVAGAPLPASDGLRP